MQPSSSNLATVTLPALLLAACSQSGKDAAVDYTLTVESGIGAGGPVNSAGLRIRPNGDFVWTGIYGEMEGLATEADSGTWDLQVTEGRGAYEPLEGGTGRLSTGEGGEYSVDGEGPAESLHVSGRVLTPAEANALAEASCSKAAVIFSNASNCGVTVTVDGVELGPIGTHYHQPDAMCDASLYNPTIFGGSYIETAESQLLCTTIDLAGAEPVEQCVSAVAILDKGREYSYTMAWENGETAEGSFRTGAGCEATFVCPPAPAGDGECAGEDGQARENKITANTVMVQRVEGVYESNRVTELVDLGSPFPLAMDDSMFRVGNGRLAYFNFGDDDGNAVGGELVSRSYDMATAPSISAIAVGLEDGGYGETYWGVFAPEWLPSDVQFGTVVVEHDEVEATVRVEFNSVLLGSAGWPADFLRVDGYVEGTYIP